MESALSSTDKGRNLPSSSPEIVPLLVGMVGISLPVGLIALACISGSVVVLVLAVIAMIAVGAATLTFMFVLTDDGPDELHAAAAES
jgi:hypothetical protein